ncbi:hypothetical protein [Kitasatospora griseola]|uniref:hypothetical protein n=1 Tax=Kitasatospora griseola TaxID=2064 RepID=UPI0034154ADA
MDGRRLLLGEELVAPHHLGAAPSQPQVLPCGLHEVPSLRTSPVRHHHSVSRIALAARSR